MYTVQMVEAVENHKKEIGLTAEMLEVLQSRSELEKHRLSSSLG